MGAEKDRTYSFFHAALLHCIKTKCEGRQKPLVGKDATGFTASFVSDVAKKRKVAGRDAQVRFAQACGYELFNFLELGRNLAGDGNRGRRRGVPGAMDIERERMYQEVIRRAHKRIDELEQALEESSGPMIKKEESLGQSGRD